MVEVGSVEIDVIGFYVERNGFCYWLLFNGVIVRVVVGVAERDVDLICMAVVIVGVEV